MAIIETEATLHDAHRDNHTHRDVNGGWLRPRCSARWTDSSRTWP